MGLKSCFMLEYFLLSKHWIACLFCLVWGLASNWPAWRSLFYRYRLIFALKWLVVLTVLSHRWAQYPQRIHGFIISLPQPAVTVLIHSSGLLFFLSLDSAFGGFFLALSWEWSPPSDAPNTSFRLFFSLWFLVFCNKSTRFLTHTHADSTQILYNIFSVKTRFQWIITA